MQTDVAPGPRAFPFLGHLPRFWGRSRLEMHARDVREYGDVVRYKLGPLTFHLVLHPDDVKHVLQENAVNYVKGRGTRRLRHFLGLGLLTSEGELWRRQRKLAQPAFHHKRLQALVDQMVVATRAKLDSWEPIAKRGDSFNVADDMMKLTLDIVARTLFHSDVRGSAEAVGKALTTALDYTNRHLTSLVQIPTTVPTPDNLRFRDACKTLDKVVYGILEERRKTNEDQGDLLSMLMLAKDEETGETMSDKQLRDEVMTLVLAGHETTANALAWTWYLLSKEPHVWRVMKDEVTAVLGDRDPTYEDVPKLKYTRQVIEEAMRIYPPVWMFGRRALAEDSLRGYHIPAGSLVALSPYLTQRHPDFWPNPEGFDPDRFSADAASKRHKYSYLPFGGGPRICIGNSFAIVEAQIIAAMITQRYRLELVPNARVAPEPMVTLRPKHGVRVVLRHAKNLSV